MPEPCTVVVASYNRPRHLRECLERLVALDYPCCRIIVVDDGSDQPLAGVAAPFGSRVEVIRQSNRGPAAARNRGVEAAETDFIAFTDDDCRPMPDWLTRLERAHRADPEALIGGRVVNELDENPCSAASQSIIDFLYRWYAVEDDRLRFFATNNVGFSRRVFREVGMLDPSFVFASEDRDLALRWRASGRRLVYAEDAVVGHRHALTLGAFWRQHSSYGRGARRLRTKLGGAALGREPLRFHVGLLAHPIVRRDGARLLSAAAQAALVFLSQIAMTHGYVMEQRADKRRTAAGASVPAGRGPSR